MNQIIGTLLPLALGISLSPFPIIMVVLILTSSRARTNSLPFMVGWVVGIGSIVTILSFAMDALEKSTTGPASVIAGVLRILLGLGLLFLAYRKIRKRFGDQGETSLPGWMSSASSATPGRALLVGLTLSAANPKNVAITIAAGVTIGGANLTVAAEVLSMVVFVAAASVTVIVPTAGYFVTPRLVLPLLESIAGWLTANHQVMTGLLLLIFGTILIGNGIASLPTA